MLPNWIIAGAPKCLTSSLFRWLVDHPQVCGSAEKETYYFVDPGTHMFRSDQNFRDHGLKGYEQLFSRCSPSARVTVEATPAYLYSKTALRELPRLPTQPSFIFVLREPVAQLRSLHHYFQNNWNWIPRDMSFADFIQAADRGDQAFGGNELAANALHNAWYADHLREWRAAVGASRMVILLFDDLVADSRTAMTSVAKRLEIDPSFYERYDFPAENETYEARAAWLQNINIAVRRHFPRGRLYDGARRAYRLINTRRPERPHAAPQIERDLSRRYLPLADELEKEFDLDMSKWRAAMHARLGPVQPSIGKDMRPSADLETADATCGQIA